MTTDSFCPLSLTAFYEFSQSFEATSGATRLIGIRPIFPSSRINSEFPAASDSLGWSVILMSTYDFLCFLRLNWPFIFQLSMPSFIVDN